MRSRRRSNDSAIKIWFPDQKITMRFSVFTPLLVVTFASLGAAVTTSLFQFVLNDGSANTAYPEGSIEYHCFDVDAGDKVYVRGTYGNFGYFEGAVDDNDAQVFHVNWFETAGGTLVPTSGAATLTYTGAFDEVTGPYWATGTSDLSGSYGTWGSDTGTEIADDTTASGREQVLQKCMYPGASTATARADIAALDSVTAVSGSSEQGENTLCYMPAGPAGGSWLGAYTYQYGDDDGGGEEMGNYGTNPFAFWGQSAMGFVGTFHASTGGYAGTQGSNIYTVVADADKTYIVGFYCNVDDALVKTECFPEYYEVGGVNVNANKCPKYYRLDESLDPLYEFAAAGSGVKAATQGRRDPVMLAILFGIITGILIAVLIFVCTSKYVPEYQAPPAKQEEGKETELAATA
jgi:hypothetical protein